MASGLEAEESPLLSRLGENQQENPSLNKQFESKTEELIAAIQEKDLRKAKQLVEAGAGVNDIVCKCLHQKRYRDGDHIGFPLYWAAVTGREYTKFLLDAGASINLVFLPLGTALGGAVYHGDYETVELLLANGADVNVPGRGGSMPLEAAISTERESAVKVQLLSDYGATAIQYSIGRDQYLVESRGSSSVQRAINMDVDVNAIRGSRTALIRCVESLDLEGARTLLEAGADPNLVVQHTTAPIVAAMASGNTKLVLMLLKYGADMKAVRKHWDSRPVALETYSNVSGVLADLIAEKATGLVRSIKSEWEIPDVFPGTLPKSELKASDTSHDLSQYVTLIATRNTIHGNHKGLNIEATTCGEYTSRNWGKDLSYLLTDIENGLKEKLVRTTAQHPSLESLEFNRSSVIANMRPTASILHLEDISNALAWICRSVRSSDSSNRCILSSSTCRLTLQSEDAQDSQPLSLEISLRDSPLPLVEYPCWLKLLKSGVVAVADEISLAVNHRGKGLKVPFDLLIQMAAVEFAIKVNDGIVLIGYQTALIPTHVDEHFVQFHLEVSDTAQINPYTLPCHNVPTPGDVAFFRGKECFVGWCESAKIHLGTKGLVTSPKYSNAKGNSRRLAFSGMSAGFQVVSEATLQVRSSAQANFTFVSNRLNFSPSQIFIQMLKNASKELAILYDVDTKRAWMVPKLSLLLHMCHSWALLVPEGEEDPIPFVEPHNDIGIVVKSLENRGDTVVWRKGDDALSLRGLLVGLNINLLNSIRAVDAGPTSRSSMYGFEFNDIIHAPGKGSCMKEVHIDRSGKNWLRMSRYVDTFVVCAGIGDVIKPFQSEDCEHCGSLQRERDHLAVPLSCMKTLMWRNGKELPEVLVQDAQVEISNHTSWKISIKPFGACNHSSVDKPHCNRGWNSTQLFQRVASNRLHLRRATTWRSTNSTMRESFKVSMAEAIVFGEPK